MFRYVHEGARAEETKALFLLSLIRAEAEKYTLKLIENQNEE
jgi:hypothetical protein